MTIVICDDSKEIENMKRLESDISKSVLAIFEERKISIAWRISILNNLLTCSKKEFSNKVLNDFKNIGGKINE